MVAGGKRGKGSTGIADRLLEWQQQKDTKRAAQQEAVRGRQWGMGEPRPCCQQRDRGGRGGRGGGRTAAARAAHGDASAPPSSEESARA